MTSPNEATPVEATIKAMVEPTWDTYRAFLESAGNEPYSYLVDEAEHITEGGHDLFFTAASWLAQQQGVDSRIAFKLPGDADLAQYWGIGAVTSYASPMEKEKENQFLGTHWNPENGGVRELMLNIGTTHQLMALEALRAQVSIRDVLEVFPHINERAQKRAEMTYEYMAPEYKANPDRLCGLIVLQNLRDYANDRFDAGLLLHEPTTNLLALIDAEENSEEIYRRHTDNMSAKNEGRTEKRVLEELIGEGYRPIEPKDYVEWVRGIVSED